MDTKNTRIRGTMPIAPTASVVKYWIAELSWKQQTVILSARHTIFPAPYS